MIEITNKTDTDFNETGEPLHKSLSQQCVSVVTPDSVFLPSSQVFEHFLSTPLFAPPKITFF